MVSPGRGKSHFIVYKYILNTAVWLAMQNLLYSSLTCPSTVTMLSLDNHSSQLIICLTIIDFVFHNPLMFDFKKNVTEQFLIKYYLINEWQRPHVLGLSRDDKTLLHKKWQITNFTR